MTGGTFSAVRTLRKLPAVRIGPVAIHAFCESERLLEIAIGMALGAFDAGVLALERELCLRVIEALVYRLKRNLFPTSRAVTGLAGLREAAVMRIPMAIRALIECDPDILRLAIGCVCVALRALHLRVKSSEGIPRSGVVELTDVDRFPVLEVVAGLAILSEPAFVLIFVTSNARGGKTEVGAVQILYLDCASLLL